MQKSYATIDESLRQPKNPINHTLKQHFEQLACLEDDTKVKQKLKKIIEFLRQKNLISIKARSPYSLIS